MQSEDFGGRPGLGERDDTVEPAYRKRMAPLLGRHHRVVATQIIVVSIPTLDECGRHVEPSMVDGRFGKHQQAAGRENRSDVLQRFSEIRSGVNHVGRDHHVEARGRIAVSNRILLDVQQVVLDERVRLELGLRPRKKQRR